MFIGKDVCNVISIKGSAYLCDFAHFVYESCCIYSIPQTKERDSVDNYYQSTTCIKCCLVKIK